MNELKLFDMEAGLKPQKSILKPKKKLNEVNDSKDSKKSSKKVRFEQSVDLELQKRSKATQKRKQEKQKFTVMPYSL